MVYLKVTLQGVAYWGAENLNVVIYMDDPNS